MPNDTRSGGIPSPVQHLRDIAATFEKYGDMWSHLRYQELGGDAFHLSGLPQGLISATTALYAAGRDLAMGLAGDLGSVTNPARFPDISDFIRYFDERILPSIRDLEAVVADCERELAAIPADFDFEVVFAQQQAQFGMGCLSPWHLKTTIEGMTDLFRKQLTLLDTAANDVAILKRAQSAVHERPNTGAEAQPAAQYAFYLVGDHWEITFEGQRTTRGDRDGLR